MIQKNIHTCNMKSLYIKLERIVCNNRNDDNA